MATAQEIAAKYAMQSAPYQSKWQQAQNTFDYETNNLARQRDDAQRSEYIAMMNAQRQLPQILRASGANGGMIGSQGRRLANSYADARQGHDSAFSTGYADADFRRANARAEYDAMNAALQSAQAAEMASAIGKTTGGGSANSSTTTGKTAQDVVDEVMEFLRKLPGQGGGNSGGADYGKVPNQWDRLDDKIKPF